MTTGSERIKELGHLYRLPTVDFCSRFDSNLSIKSIHQCALLDVFAKCRLIQEAIICCLLSLFHMSGYFLAHMGLSIYRNGTYDFATCFDVQFQSYHASKPKASWALSIGFKF